MGREAFAHYIYENTTDSSLFRRLLVDGLAHGRKKGWYYEEETRNLFGQWPQLAVDLLIELGKRVEDPDSQSPFVFERALWYEKDEAVAAIESEKQTPVHLPGRNEKLETSERVRL